jgi:hypothetical protein
MATVFRVPRVERLLGCALDVADEESLRGLCAGRVREDSDLEFKRDLYGGSDADKRALAGDIAAIANITSGVLIIGIEEDDGAAAGLSPVPVNDDEARRLRQTIVSGVAPSLAFSIWMVPSAADPTLGYYLIAVPRSPDAPHAVRVADGLRYPRRHGNVIRYLSESEVADAYRDRFRSATSRVDRVGEVYREGREQLKPVDDGVWLAVAVVPAVPGIFEVCQRTMKVVKDAWVRRWDGGFGRNVVAGWYAVSSGVRRVIVSGDASPDGRSGYGHIELHSDGSAFAARVVWGGTPQGWDAPGVQGIDDELLLDAALSVIGAAVDHAVTYASGGDALLRLSLVGLPQDGVALVHHRRHGMPRQCTGTRVLHRSLLGDHTIAIADVSGSPREFLLAVRAALNDVFQGFGLPEAPQITETGEVRLGFISHTNRAAVLKWAEDTGVEVVQTAPDQGV